MPKENINPNLRAQVKRITATMMKLDQDVLTDDATLEKLGIDSLDLVEISMAIEEEEIGVDLEKISISSIKTFGDMLEAMQKEMR